MEDKKHDLEQRIGKLLAIFDSESKVSSEKSKELPHVELIDFGELQQTLKQTFEFIQEVQRLRGHVRIVSDWFSSRITSFQRAEDAIVMKSGPHGKFEADNLTLVDLLREYEEASTRLRRLSSMRRQIPGDVFRGSKENYQLFKS